MEFLFPAPEEPQSADYVLCLEKEPAALGRLQNSLSQNLKDPAPVVGTSAPEAAWDLIERRSVLGLYPAVAVFSDQAPLSVYEEFFRRLQARFPAARLIRAAEPALGDLGLLVSQALQASRRERQLEDHLRLKDRELALLKKDMEQQSQMMRTLLRRTRDLGLKERLAHQLVQSRAYEGFLQAYEAEGNIREPGLHCRLILGDGQGFLVYNSQGEVRPWTAAADPVLSLVWERGHSVLVAPGHPLYAPLRPWMAENEFSSLALAPLNENGGLFGCLAAHHERRSLDYEDLAQLEELASFLSPFLSLKARVQSGEQARQDLQEIQKQRNRFLAEIGHELRAPLNALLAHAQLIRQEGDLKTGPLGHVRAIENESQRLLVLVQDFLDLARLEAQTLKLERQVFDPRDCGRRLEELFSASAQEKGLDFVVITRGAVPPRVLGDRRKIEQILINLISNALYFTQQGGLMISLDVEDGLLVWDVTDSGPGIPETQADAIFQPYFSTAGEDHRRGTGLGLAISRYLALAMKGSLELLTLDEAESGAHFRLSLPLHAAGPAELDPPPARNPLAPPREAELLTPLAVRALPRAWRRAFADSLDQGGSASRQCALELGAEYRAFQVALLQLLDEGRWDRLRLLFSPG